MSIDVLAERLATGQNPIIVERNKILLTGLRRRGVDRPARRRRRAPSISHSILTYA
jgi:hypothetical protein